MGAEEGRGPGPEGLDPERFVLAQQGTYAQALEELRRGRKTTHWMWFVFPQLKGLGRSPMSERYAIPSLEAARLYLDHPVLGPRLRECTAVVANLEGRTAHQVFGSPDDRKFHSSITLFHLARPAETVFANALATYFQDQPDGATLALLGRDSG